MKMSKINFSIILLVVFVTPGCNNATHHQPNVSLNTKEQKAIVQNINQQEFQKKMQEKDVVVIDVRTPEEIDDGYIKGTTLFADINSNDFEQKINALDKSKTYLIYCRSGRRSSIAGNIMVGKGFSKVYNLTGGISNWTGEIKR